MTPIDMGDGTGTLGQGGLRNVSTFIGAIPDSVTDQFVAESFADPWPNEIGSDDMSVSGLSPSTFVNDEPSVFGDGTDDHGLADLGISQEDETFAIAFTFATDSLDDFVMGGRDGDSRLEIRAGDSTGEIEVLCRDDSGNSAAIYTDSTFDDGDPHAVVWNKPDDDPSNWDLFVDDMDSPQSTTTRLDQGYDHTNSTMNNDVAFYAVNDDGPTENIEMDAGIFEFNSDMYSLTDRNSFVDRRPEV